jgi:endonuclease/exonuclease/phosphatase family metal-dependent hydrolase
MSGITIYNVKTYNILYPYTPNNFPYLPARGQDRDYQQRKHLLIQNITHGNEGCSQHEDDIIGLQEITKGFFDTVKQNLKGYEGYYVAHGNPHKDGIAVFFRTNRFKLLQVHPSNPRSTTPLKDIIIDIQDQATALVSRIAVVHLAGGPNRPIGDTQLKEVVQDLEATPQTKPDQIVILGDFNDGLINTERGKILKDYQSHFTLGDEYDSTGSERHRALSHVAVKCLNRSLDLQMYTDASFTCVKRKASDHAPVSVTLNILDQSRQAQPLIGRVGPPSKVQNWNISYIVACAVALISLYAFYNRIV